MAYLTNSQKIGGAVLHDLYARHIRSRLRITPRQRRSMLDRAAHDSADMWADITQDWVGESDPFIAFMGHDSVVSEFIQDLENAESYSWALAVAGMFHLWEVQTKHWIERYADLCRIPKPNLSQAPKFDDLAKALADTFSFAIKKSEHYPCLERAQLTSNILKHGAGPSFKRAATTYPDLFLLPIGGEGGLHPRHPVPDDLFMTVEKFDLYSAAISGIWLDFDQAVVAFQRDRRNT